MFPKFIPSEFRAPTPSISSMDSAHSSDRLLCPVRAFRIYLERSQEWLDGVPLLLRLHSSLWSFPDSGVQVPTCVLSSWFRNLVVDSQRLNGLPVPKDIGPHQVRKLAASYARKAGQAEPLVQRVMGFSSRVILRKNYVADVPPIHFPCVLPGGTFLPRRIHDMSSSDSD